MTGSTDPAARELRRLLSARDQSAEHLDGAIVDLRLRCLMWSGGPAHVATVIGMARRSDPAIAAKLVEMTAFAR